MKTHFAPEINEVLIQTQNSQCEYLLLWYRGEPDQCRYYSQKLIDNNPNYFADLIYEKNKTNDYINGNIANLFIFLNDNSIESQSVELKDTSFNLTFNLKGILGIKYLRFDPTENRFCRAKITSIKYRISENELIEYPLAQLESNGKLDKDGFFSFEILDPMIFIHLQGLIESIIIEGERELESFHKVDELLNQKNEELKQKSEVLNRIYASRTWRLSLKIAKIGRNLIPKNSILEKLVIKCISSLK